MSGEGGGEKHVSESSFERQKEGRGMKNVQVSDVSSLTSRKKEDMDVK